MKFLKLMSLILLFSTISSYVTAQVVGLRIGVNNSRMLTDHTTFPSFDHTATNGVNLHLGLTAEFKISKLISIEPGIVFTKQNLKYKEGKQNTDFFYQSEYSLTYINIPVPIKFNYQKGNSTYYGFVGGFVNLGTKGGLKIQGETTTTQTLEDHDVWPKSKEERRLEKIDYGPTFGIGVVLSEFQIELFSNIGLVDTATGFDDVISAKNRSFGISFSLRLGSHDSDFD